MFKLIIGEGNGMNMKKDIKHRFFKIEDEWNVVHLPNRPNGFAILVIGDVNHYVEEDTSNWLQNPLRNQLLEGLEEKGYTIFYSNLFGRNWGSQKAVKFLEGLYHFILRSEIINKNIHLLAEGMGGLVAMKLMKHMEPNIRSAVLIDPCLDLNAHLEMEKENKLFYKRLCRELSIAYELPERIIERNIAGSYDLCEYLTKTPIKVFDSTNKTAYPASIHSRKLETLRNNTGYPIDLSFHLFEQRYQYIDSLVKFYRKHEKVL